MINDRRFGAGIKKLLEPNFVGKCKARLRPLFIGNYASISCGSSDCLFSICQPLIKQFMLIDLTAIYGQFAFFFSSSSSAHHDEAVDGRVSVSLLHIYMHILNALSSRAECRN